MSDKSKRSCLKFENKDISSQILSLNDINFLSLFCFNTLVADSISSDLKSDLDLGLSLAKEIAFDPFYSQLVFNSGPFSWNSTSSEKM